MRRASLLARYGTHVVENSGIEKECSCKSKLKFSYEEMEGIASLSQGLVADPISLWMELL